MKTKLGDVCEIQNGFAFKSTEFKSSGIPLLRISSFDDGAVFLDDKTVYVDSSYLEQKSDFKVEKGDILIALSGATTGKYGIYKYNYPSLLNQRVGLLRSGSTKGLFGKYFYFYLSILKKEILRKAGGAAQPNISTKAISELEIPLPPLEEQKQIAAILDAADELRQKDKAIIARYDELTQSLFLDMFGNPFLNSKGFQMCNLGEQVSKVQIGPFGSQLHKHDYIEGGVPLINPTHIYDKKVIPDYSFSINEDKYNELTNYHLKEGDLIMGRRGEMGRCALITSHENGWFCGTGSLFIRPSKSINPSFLLFLISSVDGVDYLEHEAKGVTMKNLNKGIIERIRFGLPSINSQDLFAGRVNLIASQKVTAQKCLSKSEALFDSLLQKAFKGELTN